jgi:hypothetical protein
MSEMTAYFTDETLVCEGCDNEIKGEPAWIDTFYGNPRYMGPYCMDCEERRQDWWEE